MQKSSCFPVPLRIVLLILLVGSLGLLGCSLPRAGILTPATATATLTRTPVPTFTSTATVRPSPTATCTPTPTATPIPTATPLPLAISVETSSASVVQGGVLGLRLNSNQPADITAFMGDELVPLGIDEGQLAALMGVDAFHQPGPLKLEVRASTLGGEEIIFSTVVHVKSGDFYTETISIPADRVSLLDPEISVPEAQHLAEVCAEYTPQKLWRDDFLIPREGQVNSAFGVRRSYNGGPIQSYHSGIDLDGDGGEPVYSANAGVVALAEGLKVRGNAVVIDHGWGVFSGYWHLDDIAVTAGQTVARGEIIGHLGNTGRSTGAHLHWEIRVHNVSVDPLIFASGDPLAISYDQE